MCRHVSEQSQHFLQAGLPLLSNIEILIYVIIGTSLIIAVLFLPVLYLQLRLLEPVPCTPAIEESACQCRQGCQTALYYRLLQSGLNNYVQAMTSTTISILKLVFSAPADMSLSQSLVNTGLSSRRSSVKYRSLSNLTASRHWGGLPSELLGYRPNSKRKSMSLSEMFVAIWSSGKLVVPKKHVFRRQSYVIQCILIVVKLSPVGLLQKSVVKAMSISLATSSISLLISFRNSSL